MTIDAGHALQVAIQTTLAADATLAGLTGSGRVFDHVPQGTHYPYVTYGASTHRDWSTATEDGTEHDLTLHVWSDAAGRREARTILLAIRSRLHDQALALDGHRLVNLRAGHVELRREADGETVHGLIRFRAVTEPLA
ncbi:MAG: DUF3168 domain-containing protein [Hyphomicrobiaceae bacterium]